MVVLQDSIALYVAGVSKTEKYGLTNNRAKDGMGEKWNAQFFFISWENQLEDLGVGGKMILKETVLGDMGWTDGLEQEPPARTYDTVMNFFGFHELLVIFRLDVQVSPYQ